VTAAEYGWIDEAIYSLSLSLALALSFIAAKDDGGGGDKWTTGAISCAKLQSNHHHQQTNIQHPIRVNLKKEKPPLQNH